MSDLKSTRCGLVAWALMNLLTIKASPRNKIQTSEILSSVSDGHLVAIWINPIEVEEEYDSHVFVCLRHDQIYYVLDSYYKKKNLEIRQMEINQFQQLISIISEMASESHECPNLQQWCTIAHIPEQTDIKLAKHYRIYVESCLLDQLELMDQLESIQS